MLEKIKSAFLQIVTEGDNKTHCFVRWTALLGTAQGLGMQAWDVFGNHAAFDLEHFGIGLGAILATAGAAMGLKRDTPKEPS